MAFNSIEYILFLILVVGVARSLNAKWSVIWLLGASYYFYASWNAYYLLLIILSTLVDYFCSRRIASGTNKPKLWLSLSLCLNLGLLFSFKYYDFFMSVLTEGSGFLGMRLEIPVLELILPVGISFYTLQTMSYTIDVYRGKLKAEKNLLKFALYVSSFPQLVAGPIERAEKLLPQIGQKIHVSWADSSEGIRLIVWGLFKKVVIADRLSVYVQWAFDQPETSSNSSLALAGFFANVLIYADFSAYADIAIGSAKLIGIKLSPNFNFPLFSRSMPDFWKRWHISLHNWFLDYVYFPLGGSHVGWGRFMGNVIMIFLLSGLWHGAAWNFVAWAGFHCALVILHIHVIKFWKKMGWPWMRGRVSEIFRVVLVQLQRGLSMYLFFIPQVGLSFLIVNNFFVRDWSFARADFGPTHAFGFLLCCLFTFILFFVEYLHLKKSWRLRFSSMGVVQRWAIYYSVIFSIFVFGIETNNPFIYFQF